MMNHMIWENKIKSYKAINEITELEMKKKKSFSFHFFSISISLTKRVNEIKSWFLERHAELTTLNQINQEKREIRPKMIEMKKNNRYQYSENPKDIS